MEFVEEGGVTMAVVELSGIAKSGSDFTPALFAISTNKDLTVDECGQFAGEENADKANSDSADKPALSTSGSMQTIGGVEYVELDKQTEHGAVKYYHRYVPGTAPEDNSCYEFALSVKSAEQKQENESTPSAQSTTSDDVEHNAVFAKLEKILASVNIKGEKKSETVAGAKTEPTKQDNTKEVKAEASADSAKTAATLDQNPR
jgi:hypothetical protein